MTDYIKSTNFASKDALDSGDPLKVIKGAEIDDEFEAIQTASETKANIDSPIFTGEPEVPNVATGNSTTQIANTAFVQQEILARQSDSDYVDTAQLVDEAVTSNKISNRHIGSSKLVVPSTYGQVDPDVMGIGPQNFEPPLAFESRFPEGKGYSDELVPVTTSGTRWKFIDILSTVVSSTDYTTTGSSANPILGHMQIGDIIINWGYTKNLSGTGTLTSTFDKAYPNVVHAIIGQDYASGDTAGIGTSCGVSSYTTTSVTWSAGASVGRNIFWIAIGT